MFMKMGIPALNLEKWAHSLCSNSSGESGNKKLGGGGQTRDSYASFKDIFFPSRDSELRVANLPCLGVSLLWSSATLTMAPWA